MTGVKTIAFYLPQFHRIPENDVWWGQGFTEWRKVAAARPLFVGHYQPHVPADTGFYDLRVEQSRNEQAQLAREHGIDAFCYWHYWFDGRRLLEHPFEAVLASGQPDLPFCVCWANENWTRRWDGHDDEVLMAQRYSTEGDRQHMRSLARAFTDPRYLRVEGRPLFLIYRAGQLTDPRRTTDVFRDEAHRLGVGDLFLARVESFPEERGDPAELGFDAAVEFQPDWASLTKDLCTGPLRILDPSGEIARISPAFTATVHGVYDYAAVVRRMIAKSSPNYRRFPCVAPSWDNSARRGGLEQCVIFHDANPQEYERWLESAMHRAQQMAGDRLVFINAWNEWAEGNHLEPDLRHGRGYLEATRRVVTRMGAMASASANLQTGR